jgi:peptidoglycan/xylan/chitin deacetylase (PgdA/CDA1 family)
MIKQYLSLKHLGRPLHGFLALLLFFSGGCATLRSFSPPREAETAKIEEQKPKEAPPRAERERRSPDFVVLIADPADTYESIARTYLGDEKLSYLISEFNNDATIIPGKEVVIPLRPMNPGGLYADGYQTVPILCYHQFARTKSSSYMFVTEEMFERQMEYLKNNGYHVITLRQLYDFLEGRRRPPKKSVVITIDDGWKSAKTIAWPILKKYGFPAVLFVYTDLIKAKESSLTLSWADLREMKASGVFEIQSHTVTHADLTKISDDQLMIELGESQRIIKKMTGEAPEFVAYPYGVFNKKVLEVMRSFGYKGGLTVIRGPNAFYYSAFSLNRSMIYSTEKISDFTQMLETFKRE